MRLRSISRNGLEFLAIVLLVQFVMDITVILDIPIARQVIGCIYFIFIPGFVLLKLLRMDKLRLLETLVFSAGLGITLVLISGLLVNFFLPLFNIDRPLSVVPLTVIFNIFVIIGAVVVSFRSNFESNLMPRFSPKYLLAIIPIVCLPILSVVGAVFENVYGVNSLLMVMLFSILLLFVVFVFAKKSSLTFLYPVIIFAIALSLLFHYSFVSNFAHGNDTAAEYFSMSYTQTNSLWSQAGPYPNNEYWGRLNSMLSITIFPVVYSSVLNIDLTWTYMIVFPLLFTLVPVALYLMWQTYIGKKYAFIACFLFLAEPTFYTEMLGLTRQMIGEIFFCLLFFIILKKDLKSYQRFLCFAFFSFGLVVSHYALAEIFFFFICVAFAVVIIVQRFSKRLNVGISSTMVLLFFVIMFSWYLFTSNASVLDSFMEFGQRVLDQLSDFADPASRGQTVLLGLGLSTPATIWNSVSRVFAYLTEALIIIGFVGLITKRIKSNFSEGFTLFTSIAVFLLAALIVVPGLASTMNMSRFYHILLFFLAPLCILGAAFISKLAYKQKKEILSLFLLAIILGGYFTFQSGVVYELTGSLTYSLPLNEHRFGSRFLNEFGLVTQQDVVGAQWLTQHDGGGTSELYSGYLAPIIGYGAFNYMRVSALTNVTELRSGDYVYLGTFNTRYNAVVDNYVWNASSIVDSSLSSSSVIYSNRECEIYKSTGLP